MKKSEKKKKSLPPPDQAAARSEADIAAGSFWDPPATDGKQRFLGVLFRKDTWPMYGFYKEALQGIQRSAFSRGFGLFLVNPAPPGQVENKELIRSLRPVVEGWLLVAPEKDDEFFRTLVKDKIPAVVLYRRFPGLSCVAVDNEGGAFSAVEHLINLGHNRIAFINGPADAVDAQERLGGYKKALKDHKIPFQPEFVVAADFEQAKGYRAMKELLDRRPPPTAVFAANDYMALGAIAAAQDSGLSVPGHVAVAGFDDLEMPRLAFRVPSLTTVRQPIYEIAKEGMELLILHVEGRVNEVRQKVFPSQLIVRSSCGSTLASPQGS